MLLYDIIGDIHGCYEEMHDLLQKLGYTIKNGGLSHPENRKPVFLGDLTDRGPQSVPVMEDVTKWVEDDLALYCPGNHCNKLYRYFLGRNVVINNGLETTVSELNNLSNREFKQISTAFKKLYESSPLYLVLDEQRLVVAHAGIRPDYIGKDSKKVKTFVLYGDITGEKHPDGRPIRRDWAKNYDFDNFIVYGHTPVKEPRKVGNTVNIDTGSVFGNQLTAMKWPEKTFISVPSKQPFVEEKFNPIGDTLV
ncbi:bis(5'-nucleosyl)-tetraphosphatase PrpE [Bacillus shivajii]|uniref:bis(5'-nucleosyl)-tetraphosphatase PrpE n=1 Tax=Bacillus shivajii TaxID=1983719 RepID=UPI001CF990CC|nr:bis(5'-nucleosyl)-tetraphosphatase PrpE [Bacillus shivajii]UCZ51944.1 bis(5'-nucleosyl)-tetraphosphatase PrpE [Bacillus shivajii]